MCVQTADVLQGKTESLTVMCTFSFIDFKYIQKNWTPVKHERHFFSLTGGNTVVEFRQTHICVGLTLL